MEKVMNCLESRPEVKQLVMWEDPKKTGGLLAGSTLFYMVIERSGYTMLTLTANTLLLVVISCFLWANLSTILGRSGPPIPKIEISEATARAIADKSAASINKACAFGYAVLSGSDIMLSVKSAAGLWFVGKVGAWFNFWSLCYFVVLSCLTVPKVYIAKQKEIDEVAAIGMQHAKTYYAVVEKAIMAKMPKAAPKTE